MKKSILLISVLGIASIFANAQTSVMPYSQTDKREGIIYSLPKTELNIVITATCTVRKAGPFYQYAQRYLAVNDAITEDSEEWKINDIHINYTPVPDSKKTYQVAFDQKGITNNICFFDGSIISGVNIECPIAAELTSATEVSAKPITVDFDFSKLNEETLTSTSFPKMAEMTARQIYRIREGRAAIIAAEIENIPDGKALKMMLKRLDKEENELLALFLGKTETYTVTKCYDATPDDNMTNFVVARISSAKGLLNSLDVIGEPIYLNVVGNFIPAPPISRKMERGIKGFYYNVPGEAEVSVSYNEHYVCQKIPMPQFGYSTFLNPKLTDFPTAKITFNPMLGTITSISK